MLVLGGIAAMVTFPTQFTPISIQAAPVARYTRDTANYVRKRAEMAVIDATRAVLRSIEMNIHHCTSDVLQ